MLAAVLVALGLSDASTTNATSFLVLGDWGGMSDQQPTAPGELAAAVGMANAAAELGGVDFVLAVGDNFYDAGIAGDAHSPRFKETFEDVFKQPELQVPWHAMAGNHDHKGNVSAQIAYSGLGSKRWHFPSLWYTFEAMSQLSSGPITTQVVVIDTTVMAGMSYHDEATDTYVEGEPHPLQALAWGQLGWLNKTLAESTADYLWVSAHYPIYSPCQHGPGLKLILQVLPLMRQHGATGYLSGHDHCVAHYDRHGMAFALSGAGRSFVGPSKNLNNGLNGGAPQFWLATDQNHTAVSAFASVRATADDARVTYHDEQGAELFTSAPVPRRQRARRG